MTARALRTAGLAPFKPGMRSLFSAVTVVAAQGHEGMAAGLTATAVCSLSVEPPSLLVCVNRAASFAPALKQDVEFSLNVLADDQTDVAKAFGGQAGVRGSNRFTFGQWVRSDHDVPLLVGARVSFECVVAQVMDWSSHHIVIGRVVDVHLGPEGSRALVYGDGQYKSVE